jgi:K+-sensing histidine kinase KdpD
MDAIPKIIELNKYVQVIMFTSQDALQVGVECMKKGAFDYLTKPFDEEVFFQKVPAALEKKKISRLNDLYLNILVHDLRNPLQSIMGGLLLLRKSAEHLIPDSHKTLLNNADNAVRQIEVMIDNILGISRLENGTQGIRPAQFMARDAVEECAGTFANELAATGKTIDISCENVNGNGLISTDKDIYCRIITNILSNAVRFTPEQGSIGIKVKSAEDGTIQTSIVNTGSYIDDEVREEIFDKFLSSQNTNSSVRGRNFGLGLTYSKMAVEALGGNIWVDGDKNVPSTAFHFVVSNQEGS